MDIGILIVYLGAALLGGAAAGLGTFILFREQSGAERGLAALIAGIALGVVAMSIAAAVVPPPAQAEPVAARATAALTPAPVETSTSGPTLAPPTSPVRPTQPAAMDTPPPAVETPTSQGGTATPIPLPPLRPTAAGFDPAARTVEDEMQALLDMVNYARIEAGLAPFVPNDALAAAAQVHSAWMAQTGILDHTGEGGSQPADRATAAGYDWIGISENIYMGEGRFDAPEAAFDGWW
ncbi:MAG: hypothetical protein JXB47_07130, partial [Anaerolineae bacterium]|nr:hypothetical protein [Anaerolineae bacterium]